MQYIKLIAITLVLGCFGYVGWQFLVQSSSESSAPEPIAIESTATSTVKTEEQLLAERRALVQQALALEPDIPEDLLVEVRNPAPELIDIFVQQALAGTIDFDVMENEYGIVEDVLTEPLYAYIEENGLLHVAGLTSVPLPEPAGYRSTTPNRPDNIEPFFRFELSANQDRPISIYAVDSAGSFSGIAKITEQLQFPASEVRNVSPTTFIDQGIKVDTNAADEFNIMVQADEFEIFPLYYNFYSEGETQTVTRQFMTTPGMLASATVVTENDEFELYRWRIDYNGDGVVDFLVSHNGVDEKQATEMVDFVLALDFMTEEKYENISDSRTQMIEFLTNTDEAE